jgi:tetratricopeptide (TPR) repeat protein
MDAGTQPEIATIWNEARACTLHGDFDQAIDIYKYVLIRYEDNPVAMEYASAYLADTYLTLRQLDLAESFAKKAIGYNPGKPDYHYILGCVYSIQSCWNKAINEFDMAVRNSPGNAEYLRGLGWACCSGGDKLKGLGYLHQANELEPSSVNILLDLANAYLMMLHFKKAMMYGRKALLVDPGSTLAREVVDKIEAFHRMYKQPRGRGKQGA